MGGAEASKAMGPAGFYGRFRLKLDAKGRVTLPSIYRRALPAEEESWLVLRKGSEPFVQVIPQGTWDSVVQTRPGGGASSRAGKQWARRKEYSEVELVSMDPKGRLTVPQELLAHGDVTKDVLVLGVGKHMELWNPDTYFALEKDHESDGGEIDDLLYD